MDASQHSCGLQSQSNGAIDSQNSSQQPAQSQAELQANLALYQQQQQQWFQQMMVLTCII
uniref:AlNc14C400G11368 protein n=1 Tax=Albugo laibachii Nc14 TaxID=890382 RepID=F0WYV8_9STRA|nr:AlNc14C400G11368 [Albugo laibachii Nc14]|eukprot:CCA26667.1 AlNc14C400G11368 [Albugo laibachii Nc14]